MGGFGGMRWNCAFVSLLLLIERRVFVVRGGGLSFVLVRQVICDYGKLPILRRKDDNVKCRYQKIIQT